MQYAVGLKPLVPYCSGVLLKSISPRVIRNPIYEDNRVIRTAFCLSYSRLSGLYALLFRVVVSV